MTIINRRFELHFILAPNETICQIKLFKVLYKWFSRIQIKKTQHFETNTSLLIAQNLKLKNFLIYSIALSTIKYILTVHYYRIETSFCNKLSRWLIIDDINFNKLV